MAHGRQKSQGGGQGDRYRYRVLEGCVPGLTQEGVG